MIESDQAGLICYLCRKPIDSGEKSSRDHVPFKKLFASPRPSNLITIPAHQECNASYSEDEEYFRDNVSMLYVPDYDPVMPIADAAKRSLARSPKKRKELISRLAREVDLFTPGGIYIGRSAEFNLNKVKIDRVLIKIARGLQYHHTGILVEDSDEATVYFPNPKERAEGALRAGRFRGSWPKYFSYIGLSEKGEEAAIWWLQFYEHHFGIVVFAGKSFTETKKTGSAS